ncbi:MAG: hypothetical protein ACYCT9_09655 [Leptospirillum sp.]
MSRLFLFFKKNLYQKLLNPFALSLICLAFIIGMALYPYSRSGFYFDDIYNSNLNGTLIVIHQNLSQFLYNVINLWVVHRGRFFPTTLLTTYPFWSFSGDLRVYRILQISLVVVDIWLFWFIVKKLSNSYRFASLTIFCIPILLQVSNLFDGVTSFAPLYQSILFFVFISWICLFYYVSSDKHILILVLLSGISEFLALTTYEASICVIPGMIAISFCSAKNNIRQYRGIAVTLVVSSIYLILYSWFSYHKKSIYTGSEIFLSESNIRTFLVQFLSAFPLVLVKNGPSPSIVSNYLVTLIGFLLVFFLSFIFLAFYSQLHSTHLNYLGKDNSTETHQNNYIKSFLEFYRTEKSSAFVKRIMNEFIRFSWIKWVMEFRLLLIIAFSLSVIPAALISISKKYQYIDYGGAYSLVFIQIFGVALFFALFLDKLFLLVNKNNKYKTLLLIFSSIMYSFVFTQTANLNLERILSFNKDWSSKQRQQMEKIISKGFLNDLPPNHLILIQDPYPWEVGILPFTKLPIGACSAFFSQYSVRNIHCSTINSINGETLHTGMPGQIFLLRRQLINGNIERIVINNETFKIWAVRNKTGKRSTYKIDREHGKFCMVTRPELGGEGVRWEGQAGNRFAYVVNNGSLSFTNFSRIRSVIKTKLVMVSNKSQTIDVFVNRKKTSIKLMPNIPETIKIDLRNIYFLKKGIVFIRNERPVNRNMLIRSRNFNFKILDVYPSCG